jgi:hypothetical protein
MHPDRTEARRLLATALDLLDHDLPHAALETAHLAVAALEPADGARS